MDDIEKFVDGYYESFIEVLRTFDKKPMVAITRLLQEIASDNATLWIAGNGGSAAIANHSVCDVTKGTHVDGRPPIRSISLAANMPILTAIGNDIDYSNVFVEQARYYMRPGDALLLVSSSGNSPNVVEACRYAKERGHPTIAFVGFDGGELAKLADHVVWVPVHNYGIVEDTHQSLVHVITQYLRKVALQDEQPKKALARVQ